MFNFLLDNGTWSFRIECILNQDRNISMTSRIDGWRINYLCTEVTKFHRFYIAQFIDDIRIADDTRISGHETVYICPNFQHIGLQSSRNDRSRIVRASTTEVGYFTTILISRDKTRNQCHLRHFLESITNQLVCQIRIQDMTGMFSFGLDESTGIIPNSIFNQCSHNDGRKSFSITYNCSRSLGRQVTNQINTLEDILQLAQQFIDSIKQNATRFTCRDNGINHLNVAVYNITIFLFVCSITLCGHFRGLDQLVGNATQSRYNHNNRFFHGFYNLLYT